MNKILLDTKCYTAYLAGDGDVLKVLRQAKATLMSIFVLGELFAGFKGGSREQENTRILSRFLGKPTVVTVNASMETAELFGLLKNTLKEAGRPIPINDVWIAAHALEYGAVLVTRDQHFRIIHGLRLWDQE